jgi:hypothetical protein
MGLNQSDVAVLQPDGALLAVRVEPRTGETFPYWTEVGNFTGTSLSASYSNFPNPFAAGRENTTFAFSMRNSGRITLKIVTARWKAVTTLLSDEWRPEGLHQEDEWNGLNGNGIAVQNGVYVAELVVNYDDGTQDRALRKVAVVR